MTEVERLLRYALVPVDPPGDMIERFERRLEELTDAAVDELTAFERGALRDPRRWARLIGAGAVAVGAGGALIVVRQRQRQRPQPVRAAEAFGRGVRDAGAGLRARLSR